jgi:hypothetical protein
MLQQHALQKAGKFARSCSRKAGLGGDDIDEGLTRIK